MSIKVAINGFGRMGRLALRNRFSSKDFEIILTNDSEGTSRSAAHLLEFDSVHGKWDNSISVIDENKILIEDQEVHWFSSQDIQHIPLSKLGIDIVIDCTGKNKTLDALQPYFDQGVRKVIVSSPISVPKAKNIVFGINDDIFDPKKDTVLTAASCTTNALAPVVKVINESFGIKHGAITTLHDVTNTQSIIDKFHKDLRRARSNVTSLIPTSTGSAKAIEKIFPELKGKLNSIAVRVPIQNSSLIDCVFELKNPTSAEEVNKKLKEASQNTLKDILGYEDRPLVSVDYLNDDRSSIIDGLSTMVINNTQVKILSWYDNEWGYVARMMDLVTKVAKSIGQP